MKRLRAGNIHAVRGAGRWTGGPLRERTWKGRLLLLRRRERGVLALRACVLRAVREGEQEEALFELLWNVMEQYAGCAFRTAKGLSFTYAIRGNEMFVDRKDKSITRASVSLAARTALRLQREAGGVRGPKKLGTFGASYLYPVFIRLGFILPPRQIALPLNALEARPREN